MIRIGALASLALLLSLSGPAGAGEVVVSVSGGTGAGFIGCALFARASGFPLNGSAAEARQRGSARSGAVCRFKSLAAGTYAVAVANLSGNQDHVELDFLGRPKQPWGVSNNIRPALRAPLFSEAAIRVAAEGETRVSIRLAK